MAIPSIIENEFDRKERGLARYATGMSFHFISIPFKVEASTDDAPLECMSMGVAIPAKSIKNGLPRQI